jgi:hypothetical protein
MCYLSVSIRGEPTKPLNDVLSFLEDIRIAANEDCGYCTFGLEFATVLCCGIRACSLYSLSLSHVHIQYQISGFQEG